MIRADDALSLSLRIQFCLPSRLNKTAIIIVKLSYIISRFIFLLHFDLSKKITLFYIILNVSAFIKKGSAKCFLVLRRLFLLHGINAFSPFDSFVMFGFWATDNQKMSQYHHLTYELFWHFSANQSDFWILFRLFISKIVKVLNALYKLANPTDDHVNVQILTSDCFFLYKLYLKRVIFSCCFCRIKKFSFFGFGFTVITLIEWTYTLFSFGIIIMTP